MTTTHPPAPRVNKKLLDALVAAGRISKENHEAASLHAQQERIHVEEAIIRMGLLEELVLLRFQANLYKTQFVSTKMLATAKIHEPLLALISCKLASKLCVFPVKYDANARELSILMVEPDNVDQRNNVQFATRVERVRALVARPAAIQAAIKCHFEGIPGAFGQIRNAEPPLALFRPPRRKKYLA